MKTSKSQIAIGRKAGASWTYKRLTIVGSSQTQGLYLLYAGGKDRRPHFERLKMRKDMIISTAFVFIIFFVGRQDPNALILPPPTQKAYQDLAKKKVRFEKPIIVRSPDLNGDCIVNLFDYCILANNWLQKGN